MSLFSQPFVSLYYVEQILDRQGLGRRARVFSSDTCIALISIFYYFVYVARCGQQEARETWQLLLSVDVKEELLEAMAD